PDEWGPYAEYFYGVELDLWSEQFERERNFDAAWLKHQHRSPHHWQYWLLQRDDGTVDALPMPDRYRREMLADWRAAGRALSGRDDTASWYERHAEAMILHPETRAWIEAELMLGGRAA